MKMDESELELIFAKKNLVSLEVCAYLRVCVVCAQCVVFAGTSVFCMAVAAIQKGQKRSRLKSTSPSHAVVNRLCRSGFDGTTRNTPGAAQ